jgi:hypothetical protein
MQRGGILKVAQKPSTNGSGDYFRHRKGDPGRGSLKVFDPFFTTKGKMEGRASGSGSVRE